MPKSFGEILKEIRINRDLTQDQMAELLGTSKQVISRYEKGQRAPKITIAQEYASKLGLPLSYLLGDQMPQTLDTGDIPPYAIPNPFTRRVPRVGSVACGLPILAEENIEGYDCTPESWRSDFTLICKGDSMAPKIMDGDLVAVRCQPEVERGQIAVVLVDGEEATLKRVYVYPDHIELRAINPDFESMMFFGKDMNRVHVEGLAVGICRRIVN